ncbi:hypothetical protein F4679DRAFT_527040 [Xylaria curta]|nr:hypothetical protein F4679DRAFT_527040 [Xylaria curta]
MTAHYQLTCIKSWTSFRPGSEESVYGRYATIEQANVAIRRAKASFYGKVDDAWTGGRLKDGRLWYNCDDFGHEEYYKLRIRKHTVLQPNLPGGDDGNCLKLPARIVQALDASDQFRLLLEDVNAREEIIDRIAEEIDVSDQFQLLLENNNAREEITDRVANELTVEEQFDLLLDDDNAREEITDRVAQELSVDDQLQLILEDDTARNEVFRRIELEHSRRYVRRGGPTFGDVAFEKILDEEGGAKWILDYLRRSTRKSNQQFEELILGKIMQADDGVGEILEDITSRKVTALSTQLRAELTRDIRRELEVKIREEIANEQAHVDGARRPRKRARRAC